MVLTPRSIPRLLVIAMLSAAPHLAGQTSTPEVAEPTLAERVRDFLAEPDERAARAKKKALIATKPAVADLLATLAAAPPAFEPRFEFEVPFDGKMVRLEVECPPGHGLEAKPLPVVIQFRLRRIPDTVRVKGVINARPLRFDPKVGEDELRDAAIKFAHAVAWRANGDPTRLWMSGFSTGAHATFDVAMRRPHTFRGIVPMAGAPRRKDFRLLPNLRGHSVFAMCGTRDDRELIWNLRELERRRSSFGYEYFLGMDERVEGRFIPSPQHVPKIGPHVVKAGAWTLPRQGTLAADERGVRSPHFEVLAVKPSLVKVPRRIPVSSKLGRDEARRKIIDTTIERRAELDWDFRPEADPHPELHLASRGVTRAKLFWRASWVGQATRLRLVMGERGRARDVRLKPKLATILDDVRRTGRRHDPCLMETSLRF